MKTHRRSSKPNLLWMWRLIIWMSFDRSMDKFSFRKHRGKAKRRTHFLRLRKRSDRKWLVKPNLCDWRTNGFALSWPRRRRRFLFFAVNVIVWWRPSPNWISSWLKRSIDVLRNNHRNRHENNPLTIFSLLTVPQFYFFSFFREYTMLMIERETDAWALLINQRDGQWRSAGIDRETSPTFDSSD